MIVISIWIVTIVALGKRFNVLSTRIEQEESAAAKAREEEEKEPEPALTT